MKHQKKFQTLILTVSNYLHVQYSIKVLPPFPPDGFVLIPPFCNKENVKDYGKWVCQLTSITVPVHSDTGSLIHTLIQLNV